MAGKLVLFAEREVLIMKIGIGSKNQVKIAALKEILQDYPRFNDAEIIAVDVLSEVNGQPTSLDETITGAMNRSRNACKKGYSYGFGMESGLMAVPYTKTGYMDVCVCAIYDGQEYHLGLSSAWEAPKSITEYITKEGLDMNEAAFMAGVTSNPNIGSGEGLVGVMTKGRLTRKEYTKEAIRTALIHVDNG
jgi:inosine/xanthosine triphosphatase